MDKKLYIILIAAALCVTLAACNSSNSPLESTPSTAASFSAPSQLDGASRTEIEAAWEKEFSVFPQWGEFGAADSDAVYYYGVWNGYTVLFQGGGAAAATYVSIGDSIFGYLHSGFTLVAYRNGAFSTLSDLYQTDQLTSEQIAEIETVHNHCHHYDLETNFREYFGFDLQWYDESTGNGIRDYGTYRVGNISYNRILFVPLASPVETEKTYGTITFHSKTDFEIYSFNGAFQKLDPNGNYDLEEILKVHKDYEAKTEDP